MKKPVIVLGGGGHAKVLIDALRLSGVKVLGYTDRSKEAGHALGVPFLGGDERVLDFSPKKVLLVNGVGSVESTKKRRDLFRSFKDKGYQFASVIHRSAVLAKTVKLGEGVQVMAGAVIQTGTVIGDNAIINTKASVDHDCRIGVHVHIAPGVVLSGGVKIGFGSHIGVGAIIVQNVVVGNRSFVKAASLVTRTYRSANTR